MNVDVSKFPQVREMKNEEVAKVDQKIILGQDGNEQKVVLL